MIQFDNLSIRGFTSIQELDINLNQKGITLIKGVNGVGKSNWLEAIIWCLYGKNLKGISDVNTWEKIRPKNYHGTMVSINFKTGDGSTYKIIRCQSYKGIVEGAKGNNRLLFIKDADLINKKGKIEIQQSIIQALGMSYPLFISSIMFGQGMVRVIQNSNTEQKNLFEEIFNLGYITDAAKLAKTRYQEYSNEYKEVENDYRYNDNLLKAAKNNIEKYKHYIKDYENNKQLKLHRLIKDKKSYKKSLAENLRSKRYDVSLIPNLKAINSEYNHKIRSLKTEISNLSLEEVLDDILGLLKKGKIKQAIKLISDKKHIYGNIDKYQKKIIKGTNKLLELEKLNDSNRRLDSAKKQLEYDIDKKSKEIKTLKSESQPNLVIDLQTDIKSTTKKLKDLKHRLSQIHQNLEIYKWLFNDPLSPNGMKAYIFDNSLKDLNNILSDYSDTLGLHIQFLVNTTGTRKEFEAVIKLDNIMVLFEELSGGQKQLVHLAMALAMNQLVTVNHQVNVAFMDELFESLSFDNIEIVVELLKKVYKDKNLFIVTHHDSLPIGNVRTINVSKDRGISQYIF